jgi:phosphatidylinositol kinase/protein kinase (PI-3  family)
MWHEALEEASRMYFGEHNIEGMLAVLEPLHAMLERGAETIKENAFIQVLFSQKLLICSGVVDPILSPNFS